MKTNALVPWFGSNRMNAEKPGELLGKCEWVGVVFAGSMSEVPYIRARTLVVNDIHRHVMNLAAQVSDATQRTALAGQLTDKPFHPDVLREAQVYCQCVEDGHNVADKLKWAEQYFVASWMGRSAKAGTVGEFKGGLPVRWNANGGDSNVRYRSAVESLAAWSEQMRRCNFTTLDYRAFLDKCKDEPTHGIYCDAPFPDAGDEYRHSFTQRDHVQLAERLGTLKQARVVVRYYDHPLIRELYLPTDGWKWHEFEGRKQSNATAQEVLITRGI